MFAPALWPIVLGAIAALASAKPTRTSARRANDGSNIEFVTTANGGFQVKGAPLKFVGTNAYWLPTLNSEQDIDYTLGNISASGIKVVRTWAFNDVTTIPETGTWFQLINNGTVTINEGENGLQKLDTVVKLAEKHGLYLLLALTNNWNPGPGQDIEIGAGPVRRTDIVLRDNEKPPRNYLSNDYGGMDTYLRAFGIKNHDEFYTNPQVREVFNNYTTTLAKRYCKSPAIFGWELANDPRCNSTEKATVCNPQVITKWHSEVAQEVKKADPNHLVSTGSGGGLCVGCPKLFPRVPPPPPPPPPAPSPAPGQNNLRRRKIPHGFLTKERILQDRAAAFKRSRLLNRRDKVKRSGGIQIRGRWTSATIARRQEDTQALGSAYDGSHGVDSEDILNIPDIDVGSFQLFPDQNQYGPDDPNLARADNILERGSEWIKYHAETSIKFGKATTLNGFGVVTQNHAPDFVPFNTTDAPYASDDGNDTPDDAPYGVTTDDRNRIFEEWFRIGLLNGLTSMIHYQWGQGGLTVAPGTTVSQASPGTGVTPEDGGTGVSPNDGYATEDVSDQQQVLDIIHDAVQNFAADT